MRLLMARKLPARQRLVRGLLSGVESTKEQSADVCVADRSGDRYPATEGPRADLLLP